MKPKRQQNGISHVVIAIGNSDWGRNVVVPLAESLEEVVPRHVGDFPVVLRRGMTRVTANQLLGIVAVGVTLFLTKKVGDDFYDTVLKPRIHKCFAWLDDKLSGGNRKAQKLFITNIWYQEHAVVVSVSVAGKDFADIVAQLNLVGIVHSNALHWIAEHGISAPVHHYKIENGQVNAVPMLLERVDQAMIP